MVKQDNSLSTVDLSDAKILLVDDDQLNTEVLAKALEFFNHVYCAHSGEDAIEFCKKSPPDLVVLDVMMPKLDGYQTCKILKSLAGMQDCPIVFSTSLTYVEDEVRCWKVGGTDFIAKPVSSTALLACVQRHIRSKLQANMLAPVTLMDKLTGLQTRQYFNEYYPHHLRLCLRNQTDMSLVLFDIDHFDHYLDIYGPSQGDLCLKLLAKIAAERLHRPADIAARYSQEQMALVLPNTDVQGARFIAREIVSAFEKLAIPHTHSPLGRVTLNLALASLATSLEGQDIFSLAKQRLNRVKIAGHRACA